MAEILLINGVNLNLLGTREPKHYGKLRLSQIEDHVERRASRQGHRCTCFQSNAEHAIVERIHAAVAEQVAYIIINAAAHSHSSIAIRDALLGVNIPYVEVHLSNIYRREAFRHHSFLSEHAQGVICGLGAMGYELAVDYVCAQLSETHDIK